MKDWKPVLTELDREIDRYPGATHTHAAVVRLGLLVEAEELLTYSHDEIVQLREHLRDAIKLSVKLAHRITDLEEELAEYETDELLAEQRLDYTLSV